MYLTATLGSVQEKFDVWTGPKSNSLFIFQGEGHSKKLTFAIFILAYTK